MLSESSGSILEVITEGNLNQIIERNTMKVLVFDDNATHRAAAQAQLKGHDLTVVGTYDEAQSLLTPKLDHDKVSVTLKSQFGDFSPYSSDDRAKKTEYFAAEKVAQQQATMHPDFEVVLTDLLVPASNRAQGRMGRGGEEMPVGIFIGLLAAVKARAKYVAVFTDSNHHEHPASACFDVFRGECDPETFKVEDSTVMLCNNSGWVGYFDPTDLSKEVDVPTSMNVSYLEATGRLLTEKKAVRTKNWSALLECLVK